MEPSQCSRRRLKLFGKPGASRGIVETRRFEGQAKQVYSLLLLQEALRLQARTVYRTVAGSSPAAGAHLVRKLAGKTKYSCVAQLAEHPTVNRTVAGSSPAAGAHLKPPACRRWHSCFPSSDLFDPVERAVRPLGVRSPSSWHCHQVVFQYLYRGSGQH